MPLRETELGANFIIAKPFERVVFNRTGTTGAGYGDARTFDGSTQSWAGEPVLYKDDD